MNIALSVPSGYNARELLIPLKSHLERDGAITNVICLTPAADYQADIFPDFGPKFKCITAIDAAGYAALYQEHAIDVVITPTAGLDLYDIPVLEAAKLRGIPSVTFVSSWDNVYKMERLRKYGKPYVLADHLAVWNQMMFDHLLRVFSELVPERISIVGVPRFDFFTHTDQIPSRSELLHYLDIADDGQPLLHMATTELYPMDYIFQTIAKAIRVGTLPKMHLYASVHPGGDIKKHEGYAQQYNVRVRYSFGRRDTALLKDFQYNPTIEEIYMLVALFKYTNVLVNHSSTVAIESFFCDVPVINVKYGRSWDWWRWRRSMVYRDFQQHYADITREGATAIVKKPMELVTELQTALNDPSLRHVERQKTLEKMITYTDGNSSQRLLALIKQVAI